MKNVDYQQPAFEKKFRWLNLACRMNDDLSVTYNSDLTQMAWEGWCAAMEITYKQAQAAKKTK
jgi:hypothetical protein